MRRTFRVFDNEQELGNYFRALHLNFSQTEQETAIRMLKEKAREDFPLSLRFGKLSARNPREYGFFQFIGGCKVYHLDVKEVLEAVRGKIYG